MLCEDLVANEKMSALSSEHVMSYYIFTLRDQRATQQEQRRLAFLRKIRHWISNKEKSCEVHQISEERLQVGITTL
jgi:uncharacterized protein YjiS (DUF1127 family)